MSSTQPSCEPQWEDCPPGLDCKSYADGPGFARVSLSGELDLATAPKLAEALAQVPSGTAVVILNVSELSFMDSSGLHVIVNAAARLAETGCRLVLVPGGQQIQRIFEITGTKSQLEFVAEPEAPDLAIVPDGPQSPLKGPAADSRPPDARFAR